MIGLSLDSRAVLFRPADCRLDGMRGNFGWGGQFSRGLGTVKVPGDHVSMLSGPHSGEHSFDSETRGWPGVKTEGVLS